jgi:hypothetical protein
LQSPYGPGGEPAGPYAEPQLYKAQPFVQNPYWPPAGEPGQPVDSRQAGPYAAGYYQANPYQGQPGWYQAYPGARPAWPPQGGQGSAATSYGYDFARPDAAAKNGWGVASLVLSIGGMVVLPGLMVPSVLAVIFGHLGLGAARRGQATNRGMALAGAIIGYVGVALSLLVWLGSALWVGTSSLSWFLEAISLALPGAGSPPALGPTAWLAA